MNLKTMAVWTVRSDIFMIVMFSVGWISISCAQDQLSICNALGKAVTSARSVDDVKKTYRSFAVKCHPDKFKTLDEKRAAAELFIKITDFYEDFSEKPRTAQYTPSGYGPETYVQANSAVDKLLLDAAERGDIQAVEKALAQGANIDARDSNGYTALIQAISGDHTDIAKLLIEYGRPYEASAKYGADVKLANKWGDTALIMQRLEDL